MLRLQAERQRAGFSRAALARAAAMHPSSVGQIESGRLVPYESQLTKLAGALGWPEDRAEELLEASEDTPADVAGPNDA